MIPVCGVRFTKAGKIYYFDPGECQVDVGMRVIVETSQGVECGEVAVAPKMVPADDVVQPIRRIMRVASHDDLNSINESRKQEKDAFSIACEHVKKLALDMKVIDAEWTFDHQKLIFYFTSDDRVDFRELVKELAAAFHTRIELRQVGVRDQSRMLGGYGVCGRALCCSTWIGDFEPISIRHAKEQDLSLNPGKISGVCGRLKCCLRFEADVYHDIRKRMPRVGTIIDTPQGPAKVIELHVIKERVTVLYDDGDEYRRGEITLAQLEGGEADEDLAYAQHAATSVTEAFEATLNQTPEAQVVTASPKLQESEGPSDVGNKARRKNHRRARRPRHRTKAKQRKDDSTT